MFASSTLLSEDCSHCTLDIEVLNVSSREQLTVFDPNSAVGARNNFTLSHKLSAILKPHAHVCMNHMINVLFFQQWKCFDSPDSSNSGSSLKDSHAHFGPRPNLHDHCPTSCWTSSRKVYTPASTLATAYILMLDIGILIMHLHTQVEVLSGKDRGKQGRIMVVARALNRVYVEGLNTVC